MKYIHIIYYLNTAHFIHRDKISLFVLQNLRTPVKWICYVIQPSIFFIEQAI